MKKWVKYNITISLLVVGVFLFGRFYEPLPVKFVSKKEVLMLVNQANGKIVKIPSYYQGYQWYISTKEKADENVIHLMNGKGWSYVKKDETSYAFEGIQGNISVISEVWNEKYIIFHFPEGI
ncbi:hypothetical protein P8610_05310 [Fictibacillus sp. UD]|uniref:hypothetical protein n=1 Tax=Fictibacillus sp. UD TaxID=3038777 RepID=UPI0037461913